MKTLLVGVIGHVDHGKTALVKALTGIDTDRLKEERARGISIVLGFSYLRLPAGEIDLIDMPGHERYVATMISGATGMDAVLLVVAANEGIREQTLEHLQIARLLGLHRGVVAISKCDLVPASAAERVTAKAADLTARMGIEVIRTVHCSARTGTGIAELATALGALLARAPENSISGFPYMPIDRVFAVPGFGTVVTGTLRRGGLKVGEEIEIVPGGRRVRIRGLQIHGRPVEETGPGRRTAVNLRGIAHGMLRPGQALACPGLVGGSLWLDVEILLLDAAPRRIANGSSLRLLFGTSEVEARLRLLDREALEPGSRAVAQLRCPSGIAVPAGEKFILRLAAQPTTIGGGHVIDPVARRRRRFEPDIVARLQSLAKAAPPQAMELFLAERGAHGMPLAELAQHLGAPPDAIRSWLRGGGSPLLATGTVIARAAVETVEEALIVALDRFHRSQPSRGGAARDQLQRLFADGPDPATLNEIIGGLVRRRTLAASDGLIRLASFVPTAPSPDASHALEHTIAAAFRAGGLTPPDWEQIAGADRRRRSALEKLIRSGILVRTVDRVQKRTVIFHHEAVQRAARLMREALSTRPEGLLAREAGAALGVSRKFSIPLLEYFDIVGLTRRYGDRRRLAKAAVERRAESR